MGFEGGGTLIPFPPPAAALQGDLPPVLEGPLILKNLCAFHGLKDEGESGGGNGNCQHWCYPTLMQA